MDHWYVLQEGQGPMGPLSVDFIVSGIQTGNLNGNTKLSRDGQSEWTSIARLPDFAPMLQAADAAKLSADPFAELQAQPPPEEQLRAAIRNALADGIVTADEKAQLEAIQKRFGIEPDVVQRIVREEKARQPSVISQPAQPAPSTKPNSTPSQQALQTRVEPGPQSRSRPAWVQPAIIGAIGILVLATAGFFLAAKPDKTEEECKKSALCTPLGRCQPSGSKCVVGSDSDCEQSTTCKHSGKCTFDKKIEECVVGGNADCLQSEMCKNKYSGQCKANVEYNRCEKPE